MRLGETGARGKGSGPEGRIRRTALTREMRRRLSTDTAKRLKEAGHEPYKRSSLAKADRSTSDHEPDLQARWIFPTIGLSRAAKLSREISLAGKSQDLSNLRLVTLKLTEDKPEPHQLNSHLDALSESINTYVPYMRSMGWMEPVLSVPQIRVDHDGRLDPHLHALWDIPPEHLGHLREYLEQRYTGGVWIDDKPVRSLKRAAFYIASGMLDYPAVPEWPIHVLEAVWKLKRRRMIRPAGWYAAYLKTLGGGTRQNPSRASGVRNAHQRRQGASGVPLDSFDGAHAASGKKQLPEGQGGVSATKQTAPGLPSSRPAKARRRDANIPTVRPAAPDSELYNPFATPSIDVFWVVVRLLQSMNGAVSETFDDFCARLSLKPGHVHKAVSQVQAYVEASLFYPNGHWSPTPAGVSFLERALPHMQGLDMLAVELSADAVWARTPGRREFEERIGATMTQPEPEQDIIYGDKD
jgi:hypothetical protein